MNNATVIEIFSSPDVSPARRAPRRPAPARRQLPINEADIIELTSSDEDEPPVRRGRAKHKAGPVAGPSRVDPPREPPLLVDSDLESAGELSAEPSGRSTSPSLPPPARGLLPALPAPSPRVEPHQVPLPPSNPGSPAPEGPDPLAGYVAQVLEVIPDVDPGHARLLVTQHAARHGTQVVEIVLHILFENPTYPKVDRKGKGKRKRDDEDDGEDRSGKNARAKIDYGSKDRPHPGRMSYTHQAQDRLYADFPCIPVPHVRKRLEENGNLYAPTFFVLREESRLPNPPYKPKRAKKAGAEKGKGLLDPDLDLEIAWVQTKLQDAEAANPDDGIECGCCFSTYAFDKMIQCPDAHLFCTDCMTTYAETLLGAHDARIVCMDQSGCKLAFPESELRRFLPPRLLALYERVRQRAEIEAAGLEGLEECPFCDYKCVIENAEEKLFRCENEECMAVTCRACKRADHLPKSCTEAAEDKKLDARHAIEEAMTRALTRNCPKCQKVFVKESGCNKMTCPYCKAISCYVCRQIITGYDHFNQMPPYKEAPDSSKCQLWDKSVEQRHSNEVAVAAKKAQEQYKRAHPEVEDRDLAVDLPRAPPPVAGPSHVPHPHLNPYWQRLPHVPMRVPVPMPPILRAPVPPPAFPPPRLQLPGLDHVLQQHFAMAANPLMPPVVRGAPLPGPMLAAPQPVHGAPVRHLPPPAPRPQRVHVGRQTRRRQ